MFFSGTPNIFVPSDSVFMLFKCMCNNISIGKKQKTKKQSCPKNQEDARKKIRDGGQNLQDHRPLA